MSTALILTYLAAAYKANPEAEVSGVELQHELGLDKETVDGSVAELAQRGLVEWDPLLSNMWLRLADQGIALVSQGL
jgi:DNA-binding MarR family transcriptional regulator